VAKDGQQDCDYFIEEFEAIDGAQLLLKIFFTNQK
jgi:hypothetical protein